jgi:RHS repeat-associated protein
MDGQGNKPEGKRDMHTAGQNQMFVEGRAALLSGGQTGQWRAGAKNRTVERPHYGPEILLTMGENGKLREKLETIGGRQYRYAYSYDASGRLATVHLNNRLVEAYHYNGLGQRIRDWHAGRGTERRFSYAPDGHLQSAGDVRFFHDAAGSLRCRQQGRVNLYCFYGDDTRLDAVRLPDGTQITYRYGASLGPVASFLNGEPAESFVWLDSTRLATYHDHIRGLSYHFQYGAERLPEAVTVMENLGGVSMQSAGSEVATYQLGYDQVGSLRAVWSQSGELIKEIVYDSFGNVLSDSNEWFYMPIGFAGGLPDRYTGFVRFGYRDYNPAVGRFTARDPLGDTGGDHDLWDYCVDDPVNANDPLGLFAFLLPFAGAMAGATVLGYGGTKMAASAADTFNKSGTKAQTAVDKPLDTVANINSAMVEIAALPELGAAALKQAPQAAKVATQAGKAAAQAVRNKGIDVANKVMGNPAGLANSVGAASDFISSYLIEGPYEPSKAGVIGAGLSKLQEYIPEFRETFSRGQ